MGLSLMYITNKTSVAIMAESAGVDRIFVDLEYIGKEERQGHLDTVISRHQIEDIGKIKDVLTSSKLLVRVNPIYGGSEQEINQVIANGADIVMLPMFRHVEEVRTFIDLVNGRARTCLLAETAAAMARIDDIIEVEGIDEIHIGLNDMHLDMKLNFMFELLSGGIVEYLAEKIKAKNIEFGFGGIARIGYGMLPAEYILGEHYRLGSKIAILSRSFCNANIGNVNDIEGIYKKGIEDIRGFERKLENFTQEDFNKNREIVKKCVENVLLEMKEGKR